MSIGRWGESRAAASSRKRTGGRSYAAEGPAPKPDRRRSLDAVAVSICGTWVEIITN